MKNILKILILLIISPLLFAQSTSSVSIMKVSIAPSNQLIWNDPVAVGFSSELEEINGGPYFKDEWLEGRLVLKNGQILGKDWRFKYNTFQDELHVQLSTSEVKIPLKNHIHAFMLLKDGRQHYFVRSDEAHRVDRETENNRFYEVLHSKGFMFLKNSTKHFAQLYSNSFYCSSCDNAPIDFFFTAEQYFLVTEKHYVKGRRVGFQKVKLRKKSIMKALPQYKPLIRNFLKENGGKLKTEQKVLDLLNYLEGQIGQNVKV